ncbi:MAG: molybdopterin converting factor subunit 1 [Caldilineaceae bacterium]|nr:molybdopterin converting factor subunit 1 [Caldilineaceae bacterium]
MGDITIRLRLFAGLREAAGWSQKEVSLAAGSTVADLLAQVEGTTPGLVLRGRPVYAAVNQKYVEREHVLAESDEVALFPPVSGGGLVDRLIC